MPKSRVARTTARERRRERRRENERNREANRLRRAKQRARTVKDEEVPIRRLIEAMTNYQRTRWSRAGFPRKTVRAVAAFLTEGQVERALEEKRL